MNKPYLSRLSQYSIFIPPPQQSANTSHTNSHVVAGISEEPWKKLCMLVALILDTPGHFSKSSTRALDIAATLPKVPNSLFASDTFTERMLVRNLTA